MFKFAVLVLAIVAVTYARQLGAPENDTDNDNITADTLERILTDAEVHLKVKSIENVQKQVVGGEKYIVEFISGDNHRCTATWVVKQWESQKPMDVHVSCK
uniref:Cystatin domain-containing protein n=2 Tax=Lygus hesperus TaxID=30085 RepID=A0A146M9J9_LYGHE